VSDAADDKTRGHARAFVMGVVISAVAAFVALIVLG